MPHFSSTPTYHTLQQIKEANSKNLQYVFYVDIRNALPVFFSERAIEQMIKDPSLAIAQLLDSIIGFMNYTDSALGTKCEYVFFFDSGQSRYHRSISGGSYKENRRQIRLNLPEEDIKTAKDLNQKVLDLLYHITKTMPRVYTIKLNYLESDFVPYFLIKKLSYDTNFNVILSNDKDMFQILEPNLDTLIIRKLFKKIDGIRKSIDEIVTFENMYEVLLKKPGFTIDSEYNFIADILAVAGDESDGVKGVPKFGYIKAAKIFQTHKQHIEYILENNLEPKLSEYKDQILENLKLVSFEKLSDEIGVNALRDITNPLEKQKQVTDPKEYTQLLSEIGIYIDYNSLSILLSDTLQSQNTSPKQADLSKLSDLL